MYTRLTSEMTSRQADKPTSRQADKPTSQQDYKPSSFQAAKPRSLWHNRDYLLLFSGQTISSFGAQTSQLAFPLLVLILTQSPVQAGIVSGLRLIPFIFLGLPAGAWVDRWNRKSIMIICDILRALTLGSIPFAYFIGHLSLIQLYAASLIEGSLLVFFTVAEIACLPHVVEKEQMPTALAQDQAAEGAATLLGPSIGGVLFSISSLLPFLVDAISYTISVISLLFIRIPFQKERQQVVQRKILAEIIEGLRWLWCQPLLCFVALRDSCLSFGRAGIPLLIITLAQQQHASAVSTGLIMAASGVGQLVGSFLGPSIKKHFSYKQIILTVTWACFVLWSLYSIASTPFLIGAITAVLATTLPIQIVTNTTCRFMMVPDEIRGRVESVIRLGVWCTIPLGNLVVGILLQQQGTMITIIFFGACFLILALATSLNPHVRHAPSWAELEKIRDTANAARAIYTQARNGDNTKHPQTDQENTPWVSFGRYLIKPADSNTGTQEVYAFPSTSRLAAYLNKERWTDIDRYMLRLPDLHKHAVSVFEPTPHLSESLRKEKWQGVDRYLLRLPSHHKLDVYAPKSTPNSPGSFLEERWQGVDRYMLTIPSQQKPAPVAAS